MTQINTPAPALNLTLQQKLLELDQALEQVLPTMKTVLRDIHTNLKQDPEQVTLLSEEQVCLIVSGLKRQTATEIAVKAVKKKPVSLKNITLGDL